MPPGVHSYAILPIGRFGRGRMSSFKTIGANLTQPLNLGRGRHSGPDPPSDRRPDLPGHRRAAGHAGPADVLCGAGQGGEPKSRGSPTHPHLLYRTRRPLGSVNPFAPSSSSALRISRHRPSRSGRCRDLSQVRIRLSAGGKWIRTLGSPREGLGFAPTLVIREVVLPGIL